MNLTKTVYIATSLDGFIARENGEIDWLVNAPNPEGEDFGYSIFIKTVDVLVMGSGTFQTVLTFDIWPYKGIKTIVVSQSLNKATKYAEEDIEFTSLSPKELVLDLERRSFKNAYIDGGKLIQSFLKEDLVDKLIITKIPILIGSGKSLFGNLTFDMLFNHMETKSFSNGFVQSSYERTK
jgi:dihydrofolate reductase